MTLDKVDEWYTIAHAGVIMYLTREQFEKLSTNIDKFLWQEESKERNERISSV